MFKLFQKDNGSRGTAAEVWIDKDAGLCKKFYKPDSITITGNKPIEPSMDRITSLFNTEIYWSTKLKSDMVIELYDYGELKNELGFYLIQEWVNPDLLTWYDKHDDIRFNRTVPDVSAQIVEIFKFFKENNIYKINNAMSNMTHKNGKIKIFDFKYTIERSEDKRDLEIYSINTWVSKIDPNLNNILLDLV
jgi:serine/threonine protein kinase